MTNDLRLDRLGEDNQLWRPVGATGSGKEIMAYAFGMGEHDRDEIPEIVLYRKPVTQKTARRERPANSTNLRTRYEDRRRSGRPGFLDLP